MSKSFELSLRAAEEEVRRMADLVEGAVRGGVQALRERSREAAEAVISGDDLIDRLENSVTDRCHRILARHQPMAGDLRRVVATLQAANDMERMGDLATSLAERALSMMEHPPLAVPERLGAMAERVIAMVHGGLDAFLNEHSAEAREVRDRDAEVDEDNAAIIADVIQRMKEAPAAVEPGLSLFSAVRHLERIADHAANIAENAVFLVEGEVIRHRHEPAAACRVG